MCGRFSITTTWEELEDRFAVDIPQDLYKPRYNAAPSQNMLVIPEETPHQADFYRWGLIPHWAKDAKIGNRLINARAETIVEKPSFKSSFEKHRCLVLADSFYEWDKKSAKHVPYRIILQGGKPFAFAGIYDYWRSVKGELIKSFAIITTQSNDLLSKIHDRMPVILSKEDEARWLDSALELKNAKELLKEYPSNEMEMYPVSTLVNNPRNDMADVLKPA